MPTLYVENVPEDLYEALRSRAQENRKSISAVVIALLAENVPNPSELARRKKLVSQIRKFQSSGPRSQALFPASEQKRGPSAVSAYGQTNCSINSWLSFSI